MWSFPSNGVKKKKKKDPIRWNHIRVWAHYLGQEGAVLGRSRTFNVNVLFELGETYTFYHVLTGKRSPTPGVYPSAAQAQIETKNPRVNLLVSKWQQVWLLALERRRKLNDALDRLEEVRKGLYKNIHTFCVILFTLD